jgi:hypothetical protein
VALLPASALADGDLGTLVVSAPPNAIVGRAYSAQLRLTGIHGTVPTPPYTFMVQGDLPLGLTLSSSGLLSGIPYLPQRASFTIGVYDGAAHGGFDPLQMAVGTGTALDSLLVPAGTSVANGLADVDQGLNATAQALSDLFGQPGGPTDLAHCLASPRPRASGCP